eukprot:58447_1
MGNSNYSKTKNKKKELHQCLQTTDSLNTRQWMNAIEKERNDLGCISDDEEYQLFVNYVMFPFDANSNFYIAIIVRLISHYVGEVSVGRVVCDIDDMYTKHSRFTFNGNNVTMTTHPINGQIYIADEYTLYKVINYELHVIAQIPDQHNKSKFGDYVERDVKITDLTFTPDGNALLCLINNDLDHVYYIDCHKDEKALDERIIHDTPYDTSLDILKYDFNNYYLTTEWLQNFLTGAVSTTLTQQEQSQYVATALSVEHCTLYQLDAYSKHLWIVSHNCSDVRFQEMHEPILYRIPFDLVHKWREKKDVNEISKEGVETIRLNMFGSTKMQVLAFDIDKYYNGVYFITNGNMLYRIEKHIDEFGSSISEWSVTHKVFLGDVLPKETCILRMRAIRYNSVTGRIVIADKQKIQSIAI